MDAQAAADTCADLDSSIWWPQSLMEIQFVQSNIWFVFFLIGRFLYFKSHLRQMTSCPTPGAYCYLFLGLKDYGENIGFISADNKQHLGIKEFTSKYWHC